MTGLDYIFSLSFFDILDLCEDLKEIRKEAEKRKP